MSRPPKQKQRVIEVLTCGELLTAREASARSGASYQYIIDLARQMSLPLKKQEWTPSALTIIERRYAPYLNKVTNYRELTVDQWFAEAKIKNEIDA